jgi:AraC-like DNA-binding protein
VGIAASEYREFLPPSALSEHLLCLWTQTIHSPVGFAQRVLPDCCVDILLINYVPTVVGPWTKPFVAPLPPGTIIIGARCHPGLAPSLLGVPASELLNCSVPLSDVWGDAKTARFARIAGRASLSERIAAMEAALLDRVANASPVDKTTRAAIRWISQRPHGRVEQLSQWLGLSSRQIQRRFAASVGYGPKLFQSVLRFQRLLHLAAEPEVHANLAQLAADAEYADQAHMTRELQRFSGSSPIISLQSARCTLRLSGLI